MNYYYQACIYHEEHAAFRVYSFDAQLRDSEWEIAPDDCFYLSSFLYQSHNSNKRDRNLSHSVNLRPVPERRSAPWKILPLATPLWGNITESGACHRRSTARSRLPEERGRSPPPAVCCPRVPLPVGRRAGSVTRAVNPPGGLRACFIPPPPRRRFRKQTLVEHGAPRGTGRGPTAILFFPCLLTVVSSARAKKRVGSHAGDFPITPLTRYAVRSGAGRLRRVTLRGSRARALLFTAGLIWI